MNDSTTNTEASSGSGPSILTWRSVLAVAATLGNLVLWHLYGLSAVFHGISNDVSENLAVLWFTASALCALTTSIVVVMIVLKLLMIGIDSLTGAHEPTRSA